MADLLRVVQKLAAEHRSPDDEALVLQTSQETIYVWGGIYMDPLLEAPVPLAGDVLRPGGELELVRARCIVRGPKERATVRCSASGRKPFMQWAVTKSNAITIN